MASRFNTLALGEAADAAAILAGDNPPDTIDELRAALTNALERISRLENSVRDLQWHIETKGT